jgi:transposase
MLKAIVAAKKKNDRIDARTIADLVRCNLLPTCHVASPEIRELRRLLRYRQLVVRESVRLQNKMARLLMECGSSFEKEKLHGKKYFSRLLDTLEEVPDSVKDLLRLSRGAFEMFQAVQKQLIQKLLAHTELRERVERLTTIDGIGEITALTWALEIGHPARFSSSAKVMSYCGLTSAALLGRQATARSDFQAAQSLAADGADRGRQTGTAMERRVSRIACARTRTRASQSRDSGRARKLASYLLAVDKSRQPFQIRTPSPVLDNALQEAG